jgi:hypothetical protein
MPYIMSFRWINVLLVLLRLMKPILFKRGINVEAFRGGVLLLIGCMSFYSNCFAQVYRCVEDGEIVFNSQASSARQKNCVRVRAPKPPLAQVPPEESLKKPGKIAADNSKPQAISSPSSFPKVDPSSQKYRDNDRAAILEEERRKEAAVLNDLKKEFNNGVPERRADERDQQKYLERVDKLKHSILRAETNVKSLDRELQSVK